MSRCFPFPPPGYENKLGVHEELLAKEKLKEKKHKKEKKAKEKKEGKKDRSKDKHKEKKDRKEKHKDKKKEKDRDKSKYRTSDEGRIEEHASVRNEEKLGDESRKAEEVKDSKYMEEFGRRISDEEKGVANRMVEATGSIQKGNKKGSDLDKKRSDLDTKSIGSGSAISNSVHHSAEGDIGTAVIDAFKRRKDSMGAGTTAIGGTGQKGIENMPTGNVYINSLQRPPEIMGTDAAISGSVKRRIESTGTGSTNSGMLQDSIDSINTRTSVGGSLQKKTDSRSTGSAISGSVQKRMDSKVAAIAITSSGQNQSQRMVGSMEMQKERSTVNKMVQNVVCTEETNKNAMGKLVDPDVEKRVEIEKERATGNKMLPNLIGAEDRKSNGMGKQVESVMDKRSEANAKEKDREPERHKEKIREEKKNKGKEKDKHKEKKETQKMRMKGEHRHEDKLKDNSKKDLVDNLSFKPAVPGIETVKNTVPDGTVKKRKDFEMNGALHENDVRPHKLPRPASSSHLPKENGRTVELNPLITSNSFTTHGASNSVSVKVEKAVDIEHRKENGIEEAHTSEFEMKPISVVANGKVYTEWSHIDAKFLPQVYSVPKMDEWPGYDDQEWLFSSDNNRPELRPKPEVEEIPLVWAEAMQIKSAEVLALPYVIPY